LKATLLRVATGWLGRIASPYIELVRGTPAVTLLFVIYYGLAPLGVVLNSFFAAVVAFGLNGAAYLPENYSAGIQAVDKGQRNAAQMVGPWRGQVMRHVILRHALPAVLPPMSNYIVSLLKDMSLASLIAAAELLPRATWPAPITCRFSSICGRERSISRWLGR
jgi:polar amino acid transport system permease protein